MQYHSFPCAIILALLIVASTPDSATSNPFLKTITKKVKTGEWVTLEETFNQPIDFYMVGERGMKIKVRFLFFNIDEQTLDGINAKRLGPHFGACQVYVPGNGLDAEVSYNYGPQATHGKPTPPGGVNF